MKTCCNCSGDLKPFGFIFFRRGWDCTQCKGTFLKRKYVPEGERLRKKIEDKPEYIGDSDLDCLLCGTRMKTFRLGAIGLKLDYCPQDFSIWFDFQEPGKFMRWIEITQPPGWTNPTKPSEAAVHAAIYFHNHIMGP